MKKKKNYLQTVKHFEGFCAECKGSLLSDKILSEVPLLSGTLLFKVISNMRRKVLPPGKEQKQEKNQNHQSLILFPSLGRWLEPEGRNSDLHTYT